jgi:hypothetical protein
MAPEQLRAEPMMAHLLDSLAEGNDIGHYGRLTFVMVGRQFLSEDELVEQLTKDPDCDAAKARSLVHQVDQRDYNPPRKDRVMEWQAKQEFPICPDSDNPDACNVYKTMEFSKDTYENIGHYREEKTESETSAARQD